MNALHLEDLKDLSDEEVRQHLVQQYEADQSEVDKYDILIAYESVGGSWGGDSSSFFLLRDRDTGKLFEVHGSHCSRLGFEGQFEPEETTLEHLRSDKFYFGAGGYDGNASAHEAAVREHFNTLAEAA